MRLMHQPRVRIAEEVVPQGKAAPTELTATARLKPTVALPRSMARLNEWQYTCVADHSVSSPAMCFCETRFRPFASQSSGADLLKVLVQACVKLLAVVQPLLLGSGWRCQPSIMNVGKLACVFLAQQALQAL